MRFVECPQGTPQWFAARCGKITASCFADAISMVGGLDERQAKYVALMRGGATQGEAVAAAGYKAAPSSDAVRRALMGEDTSEPSDTARRYAADLAIERISGQPHGEPPKAWVLERGHEMEAAARRIYEGRTGAFVTEAGICLTDDDLFGYSSDGLVDDDGLIEIKAPIDSIKILHILQTGDTSEYDHQMQGGMWITGRKWCDFIMYVPDLACVGRDLYVKRVLRDDAFIDNLAARLCQFDRLVVSYEVVLRGPKDDAVDEIITPAPGPALTLQKVLDVVAPAEVAQILRPADARPAPVAPPSLRLGQIAERLGFALTADFLRTLGFEPAGRDKAAVLYHEEHFGDICAELVKHIGAIQAKQAA